MPDCSNSVITLWRPRGPDTCGVPDVGGCHDGGWMSVGRVGQDADVPTHVALLRGINVGGSNKVAMADLRDVVASLGHTGVSTYIQSGNVLFTARGGAGQDSAALAADLERAIEQAFGLR